MLLVGNQTKLRASGIARRRTEPGWRAAVLDERASRHALRLRASEEGSGDRVPASASGASNVRGGSGALFPLRATTTAAVQPSEHRSERSEQSNRARCASSCEKEDCDTTARLTDEAKRTAAMEGMRRSREADEARIDISEPDDHAAGIPGVAVALKRSVQKMGPRRSARTLRNLNQADGFDCMSCAWPDPDPGHRHTAEFCENGAKAVAEEATTARATPEFFARHSIADLDRHSEHWLGQQGRITHPMIKKPGATHYEPIEWDAAFRLIADQLKAWPARTKRSSTPRAVPRMRRRSATSCSCARSAPTTCPTAPTCAMSRRASRWPRPSGSARQASRCTMSTTRKLLILAGQNPGTNHPRMLSALEIAKRRGAKIIAVNPLREAGLINFRNPQTARGLVGEGTDLADLHLPIKINGDLALFQAWGALLVEWNALDHEFIRQHTVASTTGVGARVVHRLGPRGGHHWSIPRADHRGSSAAPRVRSHGVLLGYGLDPASQRSRDHLRDRQPGASPRQHW